MWRKPSIPRYEFIMESLAAGKRDKQIAAALNIHEETLRKTIYHMVHGMGAKTRCQAVAMYAGLVVKKGDDFPT